MAPLLTFDPSDLVVDMPKPAGYANLPGQEKLAAKNGKMSPAQSPASSLSLNNKH
jgi:hypothetical protein